MHRTSAPRLMKPVVAVRNPAKDNDLDVGGQAALTTIVTKGREITPEQLAADLLRAAETAADPVPLIRAARALLETGGSNAEETKAG